MAPTRSSSAFGSSSRADRFEDEVPLYSPGEERAHWLSHGVGVALSLVALGKLMAEAAVRGDGWHRASFGVFGGALIATYTISTCYHLAQTERARWLFRRLDHAAIFILIAATYTPFLLTRLRGPLGWTLFAVVWAICGGGAIYKALGLPSTRMGSVATYLVVGWLVLVAAKPMLAAVPGPALGLLFAGGLLYTSGVSFYLWHRLRYHHAIWHGFVLAGSACHCGAVLRLVDA